MNRNTIVLLLILAAVIDAYLFFTVINIKSSNSSQESCQNKTECNPTDAQQAVRVYRESLQVCMDMSVPDGLVDGGQ